MLSGIALLGVYSAGLALPFFLVSLGLEAFLERYRKLKRHLRLISIISGIFLIVVGILLMINYFLILTASLALIRSLGIILNFTSPGSLEKRRQD
jgi:cytochrome c-type biogenesis protein